MIALGTDVRVSIVSADAGQSRNKISIVVALSSCGAKLQVVRVTLTDSGMRIPQRLAARMSFSTGCSG